MHPLAPDQIEAIDSALAGMREAYNRFQVESCDFSGTPNDFAALDFIDYELPMAEEYAAGSLAYSLCWGHVLASSFGFSWVSTNDCPGPKGFALRHEDPSVLIFPYFRLLETTRSSGGGEGPAQSLWFDILRRADHCSYIPDGWHPVFDAVQSPHELGCPESTTKACQRLIQIVPEFYGTMSLYPYEWAREKQWDKLSHYCDQLVANYQLIQR